MTKQLIVLTGPTGVGKTEASIALAQHIGSPIISCDSRQLYRELNIGVARPRPEQLNAVEHHFVACRSVADYYSVGQFELDAMALLSQLFDTHDRLLMVGGSGLYIDAVCYGIDNTPPVDPPLRSSLMHRLATEGLAPLRSELQRLDPDFYHEVDPQNPARIVRALEACLCSGKPYSQLRQHRPKPRPFELNFVVMSLPRDELYHRINRRVEQMMAQGLLNEVQQLLPHRASNALKTVGYRELFEHLDKKISLDEAVELIKRNTRRYAKRQITWMAKYDLGFEDLKI
ncbi:MAG: tRNA (adenosine(37)-N6)-dimethylallyltransferase MiaA [Prevotellaceae bacterium]|jgi:tRNA dimethylallyltransferase|nr:tRNA (adenosine(37)-N6)-dimethylallyltransferase MiaA [Prevotellaceae bacterium]